MVVLCDLSEFYLLRGSHTFENLKKNIDLLPEDAFTDTCGILRVSVSRALLANSGPRFCSSPHGALLCVHLVKSRADQFKTLTIIVTDLHEVVVT